MMRVIVSLFFVAFTSIASSFNHGGACSERRAAYQRRQGRLFARQEDRKDLDKLLGEAESADADWLNSVFDTSMRNMLGSGGDASDGGDVPYQRQEKEVVSVTEVQTRKEPTVGVDADTAMLYSLGYGDQDIAKIKPKVLNIIIDSELSLPSRGIPNRWLIDGDSDGPAASAASSRNGEEEINTPVKVEAATKYSDNLSEAGASDTQDEIDEGEAREVYTSSRPQRRIPPVMQESRLGVPVRQIRGSDAGGEGEGFSWKGGDDKRKGRRTSTVFKGPLSLPTNKGAVRRTVVGRRDRGLGASRRGGSGARSDKYDYDYEGGYGDDDGDNTDLDYYVDDNSAEIGGEDDELMTLGVTTANPFWPSQDEFQDMLLQESLWRINIIGKWVTPFVKAEAKWRNKLYNDFMYVLDEGLGDGFDTVAGESFGDEEDDYDDEYYDDYDDDEEEEEEEEEAEYEREFGEYSDNVQRGRGDAAAGSFDYDDDDEVDEPAYVRKRQQLPRGTRSAPSPRSLTIRDRESTSRGNSNTSGRARMRRSAPSRARGRDRDEEGMLWDDGEQGRFARERAARRYSRDLEERMGRAMEEEEWVDVDDVEREASKRAKRGLKVIKKIAKSSVPGRVYETLKEERDRIQSDTSYYGDDNYDDYDYAPRRRAPRRRGGNPAAGRRRSSRPRKREPSLTRESLFGKDTEGSRTAYYDNLDDECDDFYQVDTVEGSKSRMSNDRGTTITSKEDYDEAYKKSADRAPE